MQDCLILMSQDGLQLEIPEEILRAENINTEVTAPALLRLRRQVFALGSISNMVYFLAGW